MKRWHLIVVFAIVFFASMNILMMHTIRKRLVNQSQKIVLEPFYDKLEGAGRLKLASNESYLIINEHGRGYNNYISGVIRGVMIARSLNRIPLIRKILVNEHLFPIEEYFVNIPHSSQTKSVELAVFTHTKILPQKLVNVYPVTNGIETYEEYRDRFGNMTFQNVYSLQPHEMQIGFIEDYIEELENMEMRSVFISTHTEWDDLHRMISQYKDQVVALHNAFYISVVANVKSVLSYNPSLLELCRQIMRDELGIFPNEYIVVQMRLGDFRVRDYTKDSLLTLSDMQKRLDFIQKYFVHPIVIITNEPNDAEINEFLSKRKSGPKRWIATAKLPFADSNPHFRVIFDLIVCHYAGVLVYNPNSTFGTNVILTRETDQALEGTRLAAFTHKEVMDSTLSHLVRGIRKISHKT